MSIHMPKIRFFISRFRALFYVLGTRLTVQHETTTHPFTNQMFAVSHKTSLWHFVVSGPSQSSSTSQMSAVVEHPVLSVVLHFVSHSCTQFLQTSFSLVWQSITTQQQQHQICLKHSCSMTICLMFSCSKQPFFGTCGWIGMGSTSIFDDHRFDLNMWWQQTRIARQK